MNDTSSKQPAAGVGDLDLGVWFRAACSGLWYRNPMAAGSIGAIRIDGRMLMVVGGCVELRDARDERGTRSMQRVGRLRSLRARIAALKKRLDKPMTALRRAREMSDLARAERELSDLEAQPTAGDELRAGEKRELES